MNNNLTKLYKGIVGLAKVTAGDTCNMADYLAVKQYFRYPGELLERMEEKGFSSVDDYISAMAGLIKTERYYTNGTFIGSQMEDFLARAKEKALKERSLLLLYQVLVFHYEKPGDEKAEQPDSVLTEEDTKLLAQTAKESSLEELFYFLSELVSNRSIYWKESGMNLGLIKELLNTHFADMRALNNRDIISDADLFMTVILFSHTLLLTAGEKEIKAVFGNDPELMMTLLAFADLYEEPLKPKYERFLINEKCFSYMDILHLNAGIWFLKDQETYLSHASTIKWWRLLKKWFQELFKQEQEISFPESLEKLISMKMPQKIDGEDMTREFLLKGFSSVVPNTENSYLLFYLLNTPIEEDCYRYNSYNIVDRVPLWNSLCLNHTLNLDIPGTEKWIKGLLSYLECRWKWNKKEKVKTSLYRELLSCYQLSDTATLDKKNPVLTELLGIDVKEFLYRNARYFFLDELLINGYLSMDELVGKNVNEAKKYLEKMEDPFYLYFLRNFCESRNWLFTNEEGKFLKDALTESWMFSIAYYNRTQKTHFELFSAEEKELLLGLMCELCTRVPDICALENLMAGFVGCQETREILGKDLSRKWYQLLDARNYTGMNYLRCDYLPKEELEAIEKREKDEAQRKKAAKEQEKADTLKQELMEKLKDQPLLKQLDEFAGNLPSVYSFTNWYEVIPVLDIYKEFPEQVTAKKSTCSKFDKFLIACFKYGFISRKEMISYISKLEEAESTEEKENE